MDHQLTRQAISFLKIGLFLMHVLRKTAGGSSWTSEKKRRIVGDAMAWTKACEPWARPGLWRISVHERICAHPWLRWKCKRWWLDCQKLKLWNTKSIWEARPTLSPWSTSVTQPFSYSSWGTLRMRFWKSLSCQSTCRPEIQNGPCKVSNLCVPLQQRFLVTTTIVY